MRYTTLYAKFTPYRNIFVIIVKRCFLACLLHIRCESWNQKYSVTIVYLNEQNHCLLFTSLYWFRSYILLISESWEINKNVLTKHNGQEREKYYTQSHPHTFTMFIWAKIHTMYWSNGEWDIRLVKHQSFVSATIGNGYFISKAREKNYPENRSN